MTVAILSCPRSARGFTIIELVISVAMGSLILAALAGLFGQVLQTGDSVANRSDRMQDARFAMQRMATAVIRSDRLLLPTPDNPTTSSHPLNPAQDWQENIREQTVPVQIGAGHQTAVLAVTLGSSTDIDLDGFADADNDRDGRVDEDPPADLTADGAAGIVGIDDDGDGVVDEGAFGDDDESGALSEDPVNGLDDDGDGNVDEDGAADQDGDGAPGFAGIDDDNDGSIDEGVAADDDEDGQTDEDWPDVVVFFLQGDSLIERRPNVHATDGLDFVENPIADNVVRFRVERIPVGDDRWVTVNLTLEVAAQGGNIVLDSRLRVGGQSS